ncbi:MAG: rRNA maturation RNase YbeY [Rhodospirillaceae bacterium]|nr:rRNA maturation RNase YbeY [Rhodospirillaceae bacterium]
MARTTPEIEIIIADARWRRAVRGVAAWSRAAADAALAAAPAKARAGAVRIALAADRRLKTLNRDFRGIDKATNVLSFPDEQGGDVAIALETVRREARGQGKTTRAHLAHMVVHGVLHLCGYDHGRPRPAARMERLERRALAQLGVADPYAETAPAPARKERRR